MKTGMLWFDNDPKTSLAEKVARAADYYHHKYGREPDLCLINPSMVEGETRESRKVAIRPYRPVLPGHLWIGNADS